MRQPASQDDNSVEHVDLDGVGLNVQNTVEYVVPDSVLHLGVRTEKEAQEITSGHHADQAFLVVDDGEPLAVTTGHEPGCFRHRLLRVDGDSRKRHHSADRGGRPAEQVTRRDHPHDVIVLAHHRDAVDGVPGEQPGHFR